ncbi:type 1 glutamine amidotransferase domain-containing protein [Methyloligella sp. 2.7D]|uniref:type 1 glutamine amidotransferase domain-containing protein n=1 Tax=unclassified Methyloligella TaxID=2625955 RepID=UPI00157CAFBF|nr:type 1 glutamine amidotransferase domain-containing protein [Methyloligella sp. GL2]QKP76748.1 type 1 glutamine amidotransferase [Methyloligella sp. GL2]
MNTLQGKTIAILAADGYEESELMEPKRAIEAAGGKTEIISLEPGKIRGWKGKDWSGNTVAVDRTVDQAKIADYDALVIPGGQINPDLLRANDKAVTFVRDFFDSQKPLAAICHGPWVLVEAGLAQGHKMTSYRSMATDVKNAGAHWADKEVVVDQGLITSRSPHDLPAFCDKIIEEVLEGRHLKREAA